MSADPAALLTDATEGSDYPWLRAYAYYIGYDRDWLSRQLSNARYSMAQQTALYKKPGERWVTLEDIAAPEARAFFIDWASDWNLAVPDRVLKVWSDPHGSESRPPLKDEY